MMVKHFQKWQSLFFRHMLLQLYDISQPPTSKNDVVWKLSNIWEYLEFANKISTEAGANVHIKDMTYRPVTVHGYPRLTKWTYIDHRRNLLAPHLQLRLHEYPMGNKIHQISNCSFGSKIIFLLTMPTQSVTT